MPARYAAWAVIHPAKEHAVSLVETVETWERPQSYTSPPLALAQLPEPVRVCHGHDFIRGYKL